MKNVTALFTALKESIGFVIKQKLILYFLPAIFLSFLFYLSLRGAQSVTGWISFMEDWWVIGWIIGALEKTIHVVSIVIFEFVILVLLTPINSFFAEKVKEKMTGIKTEFDMAQLFRSLGRTIRIVAIALTVEMVILFFLWIFSFILGDAFYYIAALLISSFFLGFSFFDFALDLENVSSKESWKWGKKNYILATLVGLIFSISIYIPEQSGLAFLYVISISFVPHLLVIASSFVYYKNFATNKVAEGDTDAID
jgi:CysZ protein